MQPMNEVYLQLSMPGIQKYLLKNCMQYFQNLLPLNGSEALLPVFYPLAKWVKRDFCNHIYFSIEKV